jgi:hypothetical protein
VEVDGKPGVLRIHLQDRDASEGGNIDALLRCLELAARPQPVERGIRIDATDNWGHFRQNTFFRVVVMIAGDGAVEVRSDVQEQDESYY